MQKLTSSEDLDFYQHIINSGAISLLIDLLDNDCPVGIKVEAVWALGNIASGTKVHCKFLVKNGIIPSLAALLSI